METTMNIKDLHKNLKIIPELVDTNWDIIVMKNSRPAFKIISIRTKRDKIYNLDDLKKMQFSSKDKNLSTDMDKHIYL